MAAAQAANVPILAAVTDATSPGVMAGILANPSTRAAHVRTLVDVAATGGYDGVDIDYEGFAFRDGRASWPATSKAWVAFVKELGTALRARGMFFAVTVPPTYDGNRSNSSGYWVYDYAGMAPHVDRVRIMAQQYSLVTPGPTAPLAWVTNVARYAASQIPPSSVQISAPSYGFDWVTASTGPCPANLPSRVAVQSDEAVVLASRYRVTPRRDTASNEMTFGYTERLATASGTCSRTHVVWYHDAVAIAAKADLAAQLRLAGVALWAAGFEQAAVWPALRTRATARGGSAGTSPVGVVLEAVRSGSTVTVRGWALDPETRLPIHVQVRAGTGPTVTTLASWWRPDLPPSGHPNHGKRHGFVATVPIAAGASSVCVDAVNQGAGTTTRLGCVTLSR
jgi:spore germination protein YaaH